LTFIVKIITIYIVNCNLINIHWLFSEKNAILNSENSIYYYKYNAKENKITEYDFSDSVYSNDTLIKPSILKSLITQIHMKVKELWYRKHIVFRENWKTFLKI